MESIFSPPKPKPAPIIPPAPPPPTINEAQERQVSADRTRFRRGSAATRLTGTGGGSGGMPSRVGVFRALGGTS